jgi:hypothetical protein
MSLIEITCKLVDYKSNNLADKRVSIERHPLLPDRVVITIGDEVAEVIAAELSKAISSCTGWI